MKIRWEKSASAVVMVLIMCLRESSSKTVYMDKYGDCFHGKPMSLDEDSYTIKAQGGEAYDTLICEMTFKSIDDRLCLSFKQFHINKCDVNLMAYSENSASGTALGTYTCNTPGTPDKVCSNGNYLTVLMKKGELSHEGYDFTLEVRKYSDSDAFADGIDAYIVSISVIIGIIVAVIVVVILTAVVIVCCCCQNNNRPFNSSFRHTSTGKSSASFRTGYTDIPAQPSAPPLPVEDPPAYSEHPPPYTSSEVHQSMEQSTEEKVLV